MSEPRVSLITPCYNAEKFIGHTIASVQSQTLKCWEQIIVDDGSKDNSASVIETFAAGDERIRLVRQGNTGMLTARVNAYPLICPNSEYLLFLDADDVIAPEMLERMVSYLDSHADAGFVHCRFDFIDQDNHPVIDEDRLFFRYVSSGGYMKILPDSDPLTRPESLCWFSSLTPSATVIRRSSFDEVGGWDEPLRYGHEDADLFLRIALLHPGHFLPEVLASYRLHSAQMTKKHLFLQKEHLQFHKKWLRGDHLTARDRQWFRRTWFLYEGWIAPQYWLRHSFGKLLKGDPRGSIACFARVWKHLLMFLTAPARDLLW